MGPSHVSYWTATYRILAKSLVYINIVMLFCSFSNCTNWLLDSHTKIIIVNLVLLCGNFPLNALAAILAFLSWMVDEGINTF